MTSSPKADFRRRCHARVRRSLPRPIYDCLRLNYNRLRAGAGRGPGRGHLLPDFLLIGAAKSGTTTLHAWIADHPYVMPPTTKEVHYFDYGYYRGEDWYRSHFPLAVHRVAFTRETGRGFLTGESSPTYLSHPWAPRRVASLLPDVRLLLALRNPVDRTYSQFQMSVREGFESLCFEDALLREEDRLRDEIRRSRRDRHYASFPLAKQSHLFRSHYAEQFAHWLELFPRERFYVVRADDLESRPGHTLAGVHAFLELPAHQPEILPRLHAANYEPMEPGTRAWLVEYFRPRNEHLSELLGFDVDWDR